MKSRVFLVATNVGTWGKDQDIDKAILNALLFANRPASYVEVVVVEADSPVVLELTRLDDYGRVVSVAGADVKQLERLQIGEASEMLREALSLISETTEGIRGQLAF